MTPEQLKAVKSVPSCVDKSELDGTFEHVVFRVEHVVDLFLDGEDAYTKREARSCVSWLKKNAPHSDYATDI
jgi:hypothetical protein